MGAFFDRVQYKIPLCTYRLQRLAKPRRVDNKSHQEAGDKAGNRQRDKPAKVRPCDHPPIDGLGIPRAKADSESSTDDALGGGDGQRKTGGEDDGEGAAEFHGETAGWGMERDAVTQIAHDVVAVCPETDDN